VVAGLAAGLAAAGGAALTPPLGACDVSE